MGSIVPAPDRFQTEGFQKYLTHYMKTDSLLDVRERRPPLSARPRRAPGQPSRQRPRARSGLDVFGQQRHSPRAGISHEVVDGFVETGATVPVDVVNQQPQVSVADCWLSRYVGHRLGQYNSMK